MLLAGKEQNPAFTQEFLVRNGAAPFSSIIMTPTGFMTDEAWQKLVPLLVKSIRKVVRDAAWTLGIDPAAADQLLVGLTFDGFKTHVKNLIELIHMSDKNILAVVEGRDSSEINQAFDRFVARAGKRRAAIALDQVRRSHITPIIDQWMLVLVVLAMLRDCRETRVWENSFVAVNLHPHHRISFDDWLCKICPFVQAANKFEQEIIDDFALLPSEWRKLPIELRQRWLKVCDDAGATWDVDMIAKLRAAGMGLHLCSQMFKIYQTEKRITLKRVAPSNPSSSVSRPATPTTAVDKSTMIYHLYNPKVPGMSPEQRFHHAVTVRNRTLGPIRGTSISAHLNVEVTPDNMRFLRLTPEDVNMHKVLQQSTCRHGMRRRVARRSLNALGGVSGVAGFLNDEKQMDEIKQKLKFAESLEELKHGEKECKRLKEKRLRDKFYQAARKKLGLQPGETIFKKHAVKLTIPQMRAVGFMECGEVLKVGKAAEMRVALVDLLPEEPKDADSDIDDLPELEEGPEYATQDDVANITIDLKLNDLDVNSYVEVYWKGDKVWYEGEVTGVDLEGGKFEIKYCLDGKQLWHRQEEYKVRVSC